MDEFIEYQHRIEFSDVVIETIKREQAELKKLGYSDQIIILETITGLSTLVAYIAKEYGSMSREEFMEGIMVAADYIFGARN